MSTKEATRQVPRPGPTPRRAASAPGLRRAAAATVAVAFTLVVLSWSTGQNPFDDGGQRAQDVSATNVSATDVRGAVMTRSEPVRLRIPSIGIDSALTALGLQADGTLEAPPHATPAGWFTHSPTPGEVGPAIIAGQVARNAQRGTFYDLHKLSAGSKVFVDREDGSTAVFRVVSLGAVDKEHFPTAAVYGDIDYAGLRLITSTDGIDTDNFVAFAKLVSTD